MKSIGVRELKANISEILREVEEAGEVIEVTRHGQIVARLVPGSWTVPVDRDANGAWTDLNALAAEISTLWPEGVTAADAINDVRRDL
jgi:prevent-host-death family protein